MIDHRMNPLYHHNIFPLICQYICSPKATDLQILQNIIKLEQLSKHHRHIIRNHSWMCFTVTLTDKTLYISKLYKFLKYDLSFTNISNKNVIQFKNCYALNLSWCKNITDDGVRKLKKCRILYLDNANISRECIDEMRYYGVYVIN